MQTIVKKPGNVSVYLFDDAEQILILEDRIEVGAPANLIIADMNASNAEVVLCGNAPQNWIGNKFIYDGQNWMLNADYAEPIIYASPDQTISTPTAE